MKKVILFSSVVSLLVLGACAKNESPSSDPSVAESSEVLADQSLPVEEKPKKSGSSSIGKDEFLMDDVRDLTEVASGGEGSSEFTIGYATSHTFDEVRAFYQALIEKLEVTGVSEQISAEEETWAIFGTYGDAILQITVGPQEENRYVMIMSYVQ